MSDERKNDLSESEIRVKIAEREARQAHLEQADERAKLGTYGGGAFGVLGLLITLVGLLVKESVPIGITGALIGFAGFGIITVVQFLKATGRNGS